MGEKRNEYRLLVGKPEGRRLLGRPRYRWIDNIKVDLGEIVSRIGTIKYGFESRRTALARTSSNSTLQTRPLVREGVTK
jgi:hypothetical protein